MPQKRIPDLSVVVLCYKSGPLALDFYQRLKKSLKAHVPDHEIILVGNYSSKKTDTTPEIIAKIAQKDRRVVPVIKRKRGMMGWDMRSGLNAATGRYVAVIDGDDQFKPELVLKVYKAITTRQVDMVKTKRLHRGDGLYRKTISFGFNQMFKLLFGFHGFADVNSKPKIFTLAALQSMKLVDNGWFIDAEIMIQAYKLDLRISEVGVYFHRNKHRQSFVGFDAVLEILVKLWLYKLAELKNSLYDLSHGRHRLYWTSTSPEAEA